MVKKINLDAWFINVLICTDPRDTRYKCDQRYSTQSRDCNYWHTPAGSAALALPSNGRLRPVGGRRVVNVPCFNWLEHDAPYPASSTWSALWYCYSPRVNLLLLTTFLPWMTILGKEKYTIYICMVRYAFLYHTVLS
jgi:hypothetical protein